jgi:hypothetical protein
VQCNDNNPCTTDTCNPASGCTFTNNTLACSDNNACTSGDVCAAGSCKPGTTVNCDDGESCTADSCVPATGCVHTPAANGASCDDNDPCTLDDECTAGTCGGPESWCCSQPEQFPSGCNFSQEITLSPSATATYSGGSCTTQTETGGQFITCLPTVTQTAEVCLQIGGTAAADGSYLLFEDNSPTLQLNECAQPLNSNGCTTVTVSPGSASYWQLVMHAQSGQPVARFHMRCPPSPATCSSAGPTLQCDVPLACTQATGTTTSITSYGSTCGTTGYSKQERRFRYSAAQVGEHTIWLSGAGASGATVLVAPAGTGGVCDDSVAANCFASGASPLTFNNDAPNKPYCVFVEQANNASGPFQVLNISVGCFSN